MCKSVVKLAHLQNLLVNSSVMWSGTSFSLKHSLKVGRALFSCSRVHGRMPELPLGARNGSIAIENEMNMWKYKDTVNRNPNIQRISLPLFSASTRIVSSIAIIFAFPQIKKCVVCLWRQPETDCMTWIVQSNLAAPSSQVRLALRMHDSTWVP